MQRRGNRVSFLSAYLLLLEIKRELFLFFKINNRMRPYAHAISPTILEYATL